jgi:hypothetical protein
MKTQVEMKRMLFGSEIGQQSKTKFFSATDLVGAGNVWRSKNGLSQFNLSVFMKSEPFLEFKEELSKIYGEVIVTKRGRNGETWVHPSIFIDIALAINPKLKVEVYKWITDNLIEFRNDSGDSYCEMSSAIFENINKRWEGVTFIQNTALEIKKALDVDDWQKASEAQLKKRDEIHRTIKLLCNVLKDSEKAVRIGLEECLKTKPIPVN